MREIGWELYGPEMSPHNSQLVACGGAVVVGAVHSDTTANDVVVVVGAAAAVVVWVQQCWMRVCTNL